MIFFSKNKRSPSITYGITVHNEATEVETLLQALIGLINKNDEILVLQDITNCSNDVDDVLARYKHKITHIQSKLNGDFSAFKNNLIKEANKKYLFQIDSDEIPDEYLIRNIKPYLKKKKDIDIFLVPRVNIVKNITAGELEKWDWKLNEEGYINFPDYQCRIIKLKQGVFWENKVHERLTGSSKIDFLPSSYNFSLIHIKDIVKQREQNIFYNTL